MKREIEKQKEYSEFEKTNPEQLNLFSFDNIYSDKREQYSNTVELYDILPKYIHDDVEKYRTKEGLLKPISRNFQFKKEDMILNISPAYIFDKEKAYYPSQREEVVEDVLRRMATNRERNEFLDDRLSVRFTLYELWKELKKIKHEYNYSQIRESLEVLAKTNIEIKTADGKVSFSSNMFETLGQVDTNKDVKDGDISDEYSKNLVYFVRFNSLVSESIKNKTWRIINYDQCMKYRKEVSRWLHKRISHMFLVGNIEIPFNILLSTIIRDSGMKSYDLISGNIRQVEECIKEMMKVGSIRKYRIKKIYSKTKKNKIEDAMFYLWVSESFYSDIQLGFLALQDRNKIAKIQEAIRNNKNSNADYCENKDRDATNDGIKKEIKDLLKQVDISDKDIKKILLPRSDGTKLKRIKKNIEAAIEYIMKQSTCGNQDLNNIAIVLSSIKNNWKNSKKIEQNNTKTKEKIYSDSEKQEIVDKMIAKISDKNFKKISIDLAKYFGNDAYMNWLSKLEYVSIKNDTLILSCKNLFVVDNIKRSYLNGVYKKENGKKILLRKGIKEIVQDTIKGIKNIKIE